MKKQFFKCLIVLLTLSINTKAQNPIYTNEKAVTIVGYTLDAMEPHLSTDGNAMFFNSLNNGINTSLHYAAKVNDTVFNYVGLVPIVNQTITPRLDAVASLDTANNFYWVSTRTWPTIIENLQRIRFLTAGYSNFGRVYGDFYINAPNWLIMDAAVNYYGDKLIYCNAWFNSCTGGVPCKASMGMAQKINDSTFNKMPTTNTVFAAINDTVNYIVYAPCLTKDELELYYTRLLKNGTQTEIMVASRSNTNNAFGTPTLLIGSPAIAPEAATLTSDKSKLYFHKKMGATYKLFLRYRASVTKINEIQNKNNIIVYPNPTTDYVFVNSEEEMTLRLFSIDGTTILSTKNNKVNLTELAKGIYFLEVRNNFINKKIKIIKN
ncbi:MAG: T9SS type A sorting domain-containing protein [Bacteroidota bacterium]|nr:T9SS type A sorting domain-containing protein [Bacteroidota bacterium]